MSRQQGPVGTAMAFQKRPYLRRESCSSSGPPFYLDLGNTHVRCCICVAPTLLDFRSVLGRWAYLPA